MKSFPDKRREQYLEKALPSHEEAERVLLGGILLDNSLIAEAAERLTPHDFYSPMNRRIFQAMLTLFQESKQIDPILIGAELKKEGSLESMGGITAITNLTFGLPHFSEASEYVRLIRDASILRDLVRVCGITTNHALSEEDDAADVLDAHESLIHELRDKELNHGFTGIGPLAMDAAHQIKDNAQHNIQLLGISSGLRELDEITDGLQETDFIVLAGRPSMGKTALALTIACNVAGNNTGAVVAVFSMEMNKKQIAKRILASESLIIPAKFKKGFFTADEAARLEALVNNLQHWGLEIDDAGNLSALEIRAKARRLKARRKRLDLIIIDYIQLMKGTSRKQESRQQEVSEISRQLKGLAKDLNVPVIALSQLSRKCEDRRPPKPILSDLRESGSIEQDADIVAMIYRGEYYHETDDNKGVAEIIIGKNRNGPTGMVKLAYMSQFTKFENLFNG